MTNPHYTLLQGPYLPELLRHETLPEIFEATAARLPNKIALIYQSQQLTYAELNAQADVVAHHLIERGVTAGSMVGLWMHRGLDLLVAMLGITKAGAAWLPMDADLPADRVETCLEDANAVGIITDFELPSAATVPGWTYAEVSTQTDTPLQRRTGHVACMPAYVIYTSGSTGKPKGICINHGSISHFLRSENHNLGIREDDKVYQGFSVAFDMSFEEIWISYLVGATLWIAPKALVSDPQALPIALRDHHITVLHAVPTLLALFAEDVPNLRLINLGGEMCPDSVVDRWWAPNRQMFNTYGPTEATVSASLASLVKGQPVTIGTPLPNYGLLVMNEQGEALPAEETGELCIFGPGVSDGYLGRPDLTAEKFITNCYATRPDEERLYRTGDLAIINADGTVQCLGRADDQIKIRGFRVELGEIEAALCDIPGIGTAAVLLKPINGMDQLVAFMASEEITPPSIAELRQQLRQRFPVYMVPAFYEYLAEVPRLTSGKIDRKALKAREISTEIATSEEEDIPQNETETMMFEVLRQLFPGHPIKLSADFFDDMGGHSLLAARMVSELRAHPSFASITVQDIYQLRSIGKIAEKMHLIAAKHSAAPQPKPANQNSTTWRRLCCGLAQGISTPVLIALRMLTWLAPFVTYHLMTGDDGDSIALAIAASIGIFLLSTLLSFVLPVLMVRGLQLHLKPGTYPLWGIQYFRWWLSNRLTEVIPVHLISGSTLYPLYLRAMGAKIGKGTEVSTAMGVVPDMLTLGKDAFIADAVMLGDDEIDAGWMTINHTVVGDRTFIGNGAYVPDGTLLPPEVLIGVQSTVPAAGQIRPGETWMGSPSIRLPARESLSGFADHLTFNPSWRRRVARGLIEAARIVLPQALTICAGYLIVLDVLPEVENEEWSKVVMHLALDGAIYGLSCFIFVLLLKWILIGRYRPKAAPMWTMFVWLSEAVTNLYESIAVPNCVNFLRGTPILPWVLRLMGAHIGKQTYLDTTDITEFDCAYIGDGVEMNALTGPQTHLFEDRIMKIGEVHIAADATVHPRGTILYDAKVGEEVVLGPLSLVMKGETLPDHTRWIGTPATPWES